MGEAERLQTGPQLVTQQEAGEANRDEPLKTERFLELHMKEIMSFGAPAKTIGAVAESESHLMPPSVQIERKTDTQEFKAVIRLAILENGACQHQIFYLPQSSMMGRTH